MSYLPGDISVSPGPLQLLSFLWIAFILLDQWQRQKMNLTEGRKIPDTAPGMGDMPLNETDKA